MKHKIINIAILTAFLGITAYLFSQHFYLSYEKAAPYYKTATEIATDYEQFRAWMVLITGVACLGLVLTIGREKKDY